MCHAASGRTVGSATFAVVFLAAAVSISLFTAGCGSDEDNKLIARVGANQVVLVGRPARLDSTGSRHTGGRPIEYNWSVVQRPTASRAEVVLEADAQPEFTADRPGVYVFELVVSSGTGVSAPARVMALADYAPADFVYIDTRVVSGDATTIGSYQISMGLSPTISAGPTLYPAPAFTDYTGAPVGFQVLVLNRADGTVRSHKSYPITTNTRKEAGARAEATPRSGQRQPGARSGSSTRRSDRRPRYGADTSDSGRPGG